MAEVESIVEEEEDWVEVPEHLHDYVEQNRSKLTCRNCEKSLLEGKDLLRQDGNVYCSQDCKWTAMFGGPNQKKKSSNRKPEQRGYKPKASAVMERAKPTGAGSSGTNGNAMYLYHLTMGTSLHQQDNTNR